MISFDEFRKLYNAVPGEPEFEITFSDLEKEYMIIKYDDHVSFQRCGYNDGSGEYEYPDLDTLFQAKSVDGICLKDCWNSIETIIADATYDLSLPSEFEDYKRRFGIQL